MKSLKRGVVGAGAVAFAILGGSREAKASGFAAQRFGGEQGSVVATNPTAVYYNPGAMGFSGAGALGVYGTLALRSVTWSRAPAASDVPTPDAQVGNIGEARLFNVFGGPAIGGTVRFGHLVLGGGFFAPFFGRAHWDKNDTLTAEQKAMYPLAVDGVQRWFGIDAELSVLYFSAGAAYRLGPLSIGATGNVIYSTILATQAKNPTGKGLADTTSEGRAVLDVRGINGSFAVGAMLEVIPDQFWLAASYQAQPGLGQQKLTGTLNISSPAIGNLPTSNVGFYQTLPDVFRAGGRWHLKNAPWEFRLFGDLTRWSAMTSQCISVQPHPCIVNTDGSDATGAGAIPQNFRRNWSDTYGVRVGASYWVKPAIEVFIGAGYETAAVPDATMTPDLTDANNISGALGGRFGLTESLFLSASYTHQQFMNRDNTGKSTLAVSNGVAVQVPTVQSDGGGQYTQWIGYINANLEALFP
jgi:long-chain fatty acid transport protein